MYLLLAAEVVKRLHYPRGVTQQSIRGGCASGCACSEVNPLTLLYTCTIFDRKGTSFVYRASIEKWYLLNIPT